MRMDEKTIELVGIAASVAGHCQPCLRYHMSAAKKLGIEKKDIWATIAPAKAMSRSGNESMVELSGKLMDRL